MNIITRNLMIVFVSITFSGCSSTAPSGTSAPDPDAASDMHQPATKAPQPAAEAKAPAIAADMPIPPEGKRSDDKYKDEIVPRENSIYFSFGKAEIDHSGTILLRQHAARLKEDRLQTVTLVAFTDNLGSRSLNLAIAEERINAVVSTLRSLGVPRKQIRRKSAGLSKLSSACNTPACRQMMRRVELVYE